MDFNNIRKEVLSSMHSSRNNEIEKANTNLIKILNENVDLKKIYIERKSLVKVIAQTQIDNKSITQLMKNYLNLGNKFKSLVVEKKINFTQLMPNFQCKICKDSGIINNEYCSCLKKRLKDEYRKYNNLETNPNFNSVDFNFIKDKSQREQNIKLYQTIEKLLDKKPNIITIFGDVGVGKTHLLKCIANSQIEKLNTTIMLTAFAFNNEMLKIHCSSVFDKEKLLSVYLNCDVLCLDDLGTENIINNVTVEYLYLLLNERINNKKTTIITTNLTLEQLRDVYDDRIFSRIADSENNYMFKMKGKDLRLKI